MNTKLFLSCLLPNKDGQSNGYTCSCTGVQDEEGNATVGAAMVTKAEIEQASHEYLAVVTLIEAEVCYRP